MRGRMAGGTVALMAAVVCACSQEAPVVEAKGDCADVFQGQVCTWAKTKGNDVVEVGATIPLASITNAPGEPDMSWPPKAIATLTVPGSEQSGLLHMDVFWEAAGHPPGPYLTPHWDFHFYTVPQADVTAIDCSDLSKPSELPAAYSLPDVPLPDEMAQMVGTKTLIGLCVPNMGMHALLSSELASSETFRGTMVVGYYKAKPIFVEPMITKAMLEEKKPFDLTIPTVPGMTGKHPTMFHADFDDATQSYRFVFSGFAAAG